MQTQTKVFDRLVAISLSLTVVLLPVFFLPFVNVSIRISKGLLLVAGLALSIIFWAISRFFDGKFIFPKSLPLLSALGVVLIVFISAMVSSTKAVSLFGTMLDTGTFWFIFLAFLLMFMSSVIFRDTAKAKMLVLGVILSSVVLLVFQGLRLFVPDALSLGLLSGKTANVLGSWNALGLFAGSSVLASLLVIEFFLVSKMMRTILQAVVVLSVIFVAVVNFQFAWELVGIFSLIIFIYKISRITRAEKQSDDENEEKKEKRESFPMLSFFIIMVSLLFFVSGQFVGGILPNSLGVANSEVRPSIGATMSVTRSVLDSDPILGIGPNKFEEAWAMHKPLAVNNSQFWDVSFASGSGLLPTFVATTGYLGILSWLAFLILFIFSGAKDIFSSVKNNGNWEAMIFFVLSLYLFTASLFYPTGSVIFLLAMAFAGVYIGLSASSKENGEVSFSFLNDHRKSFFSMLFIVLLVIVAVVLTSKYIERFASVFHHNKSLTASSVAEAELSINRALTLHRNDLYLRTYAQVYLLKLNSLLNEGTGEGEATEAQKIELQTTLDRAIGGAQLAIAYNPNSYLNFQALGSVYQSAAMMGVKDAYSRALDAYISASNVNPNNPGIKLSLASVSLADKKVPEAKEYANTALTLKPNYIDALIVLSQISTAGGDKTEALSYAQRALSLAPSDESLIKYVDSLRNPTSSEIVPPDTSSITSEDDTGDISDTENGALIEEN
jgi:cytochrome c-type biogenesis protein CcmH/NrfG